MEARGGSEPHTQGTGTRISARSPEVPWDCWGVGGLGWVARMGTLLLRMAKLGCKGHAWVTAAAT